MKNFVIAFTLIGISAFVWNKKEPANVAYPSSLYIASDSAELVNLLTSLAAKEKNLLLKRHFESVAMISSDKTHGYGFTEEDQKNAAGTIQFFKGEGAQWETYLNKPRPLIMAFRSKTDNKNSYYWLFVPKNFDPKKTDNSFYLELHGSGGGKNNNPHVMLYQPLQPQVAGVTNQGYRRDGFMILPWGRGDKGYRDTAEKDIWECLQDFDSMFKTDPKRQFIYGFSMGGAGTYSFAQKSLDRWAAAGMYSGSTRNPTPEDAQKFKAIPVWMAWGEQETRLAENNRKLIDYFKQSGVDVTWTEVKGVGHSYLGEYQDSLMNWFIRHPKP